MPEAEIKKTVQPWIVSLGISVFCCALFFAIMSNYVSKLNDTLLKIDARLAAIEGHPTGASDNFVPGAIASPIGVPNPSMPVGVPTITPPTITAPTITAPALQPSEPTPTPSGSTEGSVGNVPSAAPAPEAIAPVLPSVPASAAPINADVPTKLDAPAKQ